MMAEVSDTVDQQQKVSTGAEGETSSSKKRFSLRESLSEVKSVMDADSKTSDERLPALHKLYQGLARDYKRLERRLVECQRKQLEVAQHRDIIQTEHARVNLAKTKLENLCRELQKHNKAVVEESRQRQRQDEERRREVSGKFQATINEITVKMQEQHQKNESLRQENFELASKLKQFSEQYEARDEHFEKILKHKQLELQLCEAKLAQQTVAAAEEKETSLAERQYLLAETLEQQKKCEMLTQQEADLRGQLSLYSDKFEEFQQTLTKSNQVFSSFKKEMDKMAKTISTLEKEAMIWKGRYEKCSRSLLESTTERCAVEQSNQVLQSKNEKLEKLCRALQSERNELRKRTKEQEGQSLTTNDSSVPCSEEDKDRPLPEDDKLLQEKQLVIVENNQLPKNDQQLPKDDHQLPKNDQQLPINHNVQADGDSSVEEECHVPIQEVGVTNRSPEVTAQNVD